MLDYTCLETVHRYGKPARGDWDARFADTVRMEVLFTGAKEMYSAPGDRHFSEEHPEAFAGGGFSQNGLFGLYLDNVVASGAALYQYRGEENLAGRGAARYDFTLPGLNQTLSLGNNIEVLTGTKGTFWADPKSLDVLRLDVRADDIPPQFPVASSTAVLDYAPVRIGERDIMLLQSADSRMELRSGQVNRNLAELTHCRSFEAQSSISFAPAGSEPGAAAPAFMLPGAEFARASQAIPAGLRVTLALSEAVTGKMAVGAPIDARIANVTAAKGARAAIPDGAVVRGRVRRLERPPDSGAFLVALEFTDVEVDGTRLRFYAEMEKADRASGVEALVTAGAERAARPKGRTPNLPGVAYFLVRGKSTEIPKGFAIVWKTEGMI